MLYTVHILNTNSVVLILYNYSLKNDDKIQSYSKVTILFHSQIRSVRRSSTPKRFWT